MLSNLYDVVKRKYVLTNAGKDELIQQYNLGYSQQKIAKKFNVSEDTVRAWMKENNIPTRTRKYSINENYFETIDTPEKAYWLGFLSADGYIDEARKTIQLELQESDKEHIEKFAKAIQYFRPILTIKCGVNRQFIHYRIVVNCKKMVNDLLNYNVTQNKSLTFYPKNIPSNLFDYWILGYMDGDGSITISKGRIKIGFTGTEETLKQIKKHFNSSNQIRLEHRCDNTYNFTLEVDLSEQFLHDIKYNELDFVLNRKQQRYCLTIQ